MPNPSQETRTSTVCWPDVQEWLQVKVSVPTQIDRKILHIAMTKVFFKR